MTAPPIARATVYCQPGARQTELCGLHGGVPKLRLQAPPLEGAANRALAVFLAGLCGVPKSAVSIESGASSRTKRVALQGVTQAQLDRALGLPACLEVDKPLKT